MRPSLSFCLARRVLAAATFVSAFLVISACGLLPERPNYPQAPIIANPARKAVSSLSTPCAKIHWQNLGAARDINKAIAEGRGDGSLTPATYGPRPAAISKRADDAALGKPIDPNNLERRSERSVELSVQYPGEYQKAYAKAIEQWLQQHVAVELHTCTG